MLCRYSEIALKGKNRHLFEHRLITNIDLALKKNDIKARIKKPRGRVIVYTTNPKAGSVLKKVFGLSSFSPAFEVPSELEAIKEFSKKYSDQHTKESRTFRITAKRPIKDFPLTSNELDVEIGNIIGADPDLKVNLKNPDFNLNIEIHKTTFIFHEKIVCHGGLPVGVSGKIACILRKQDDLLLPLMLMKRGCTTTLLLESDIDTAILGPFAPQNPVKILVKSVKDINEAVLVNDCKALAVPDLLLDISRHDYNGVDKPILTPFVSHTQKDIKRLLKRFTNV